VPTAQTTLEKNESIEKAYPHDIRVIRVDREEQRPLYRFDAPFHQPKDTDTTTEWENPEKAKLYAAVYTAVGGFREEKTGRRGVPPEVQRDGMEATVAYLSTQDGMGTEWLSNFYGLDPQRIYEYRSRIRSRAAAIAEQEANR